MKQIDLSEFEFKDVVFTLTDGSVHKGYVDLFTKALDNEPEEDSIGVMPNKNSHEGIEYFLHEITEIHLA